MNQDRRVLHKDLTGDDVRQLHRSLASLGVEVPGAESQNASFGPETHRAVTEFQTAQGLEPTGIVDANTAAVLDQAVAATVYLVTGTVSSPDRAGVGGLSVQLVDKGVGADVPLGIQAATDIHGQFKITVSISPAQMKRRMKTAPDLQVTVSFGAALIGSSDVVYNAITPVTLNVLLPPGITTLPSEYETLAGSLAVNYSGELGDLQESNTRQDITYLANKTGWDARVVALAALSGQFSVASGASAGATGVEASNAKQGTAGIRPEFYYALFRAGFPANPAALYRIDPQAAAAVWKQAVAQGVIPSSLSAQIPAAAQSFQSLAAAQVLEAPPAAGVSNLGQLLQVTLGDDTKAQQQFSALYVQYQNDPASLWKAVQQQFGAATTARLQLDGQLGYLTINNADLISKLHQAAASAPLMTTLDLVARGFYQASAWASLITSTVPAQIPGSTLTEQKANYASLLASQIRIAYPTAVMADLIKRGTAQVIGGQTVQTGVTNFLNAQQEQFNIGTEPVEAYIARTKISGTPAGVVSQIKRIQRVYQITQTDQAMTVLLDPRNRIDSAYQVTRHTRSSFVAAYGAAMGGEEIAAQTYSKAQQVYSAVLNVASTYLLAQRAPVLGSASAPILVGAAPLNMLAAQTLPPAQATLATLFGSLDYCRCDDCRSILGPAAYLVDLLDYIDIPATGAFMNPQDALFARRPDIQYLPLTCENTNTVLPYIDLVNETLEYFLANSLSLNNYAGHDTGVNITSPELLASPQYVNEAAYTLLKTTWFPSPLPFHRELELLRLHFQKLGVPLADAMQVLLPDAGLAASGTLDILLERGGFSRDEYRLLTDSTLTLQQIYGYPGLTDAAVITALSSFEDYSRRTGVSYLDLTSLLETQFINPNCVLIPKLNGLNVPITAIQALGTAPTPAQITAFQALLPAGLDPAEFGGDVIGWLTNPANFANIMGLIVVANPVDATDLCTASGLQFGHADGSPLTAIEFVRMLRFQRLWQKLGWTINQTDDLATALCPPATDAPGLDASFRVFLGRLGFLMQMMGLLELTADDDLQSLVSCWAPIGVGTGSLYESMFLTPTLLQQDPAFAPDPYGAVLGDRTEMLLDHEPALRSALNLTGAEFSLIAAALSFDENTPLTLENVSDVFRQGWLARTLELSVVEFLTLKQFTGIDPFDSPDAAFSITAANGTMLVITAQPAAQTGGIPLADVVVHVQDGHGNDVASTVPVTLSSSPAGVSMSVNAAGGIATFSGGLVFNSAGSYTLTATARGAAPAISQTFTISAAAPAQLAFTTQPRGGTAAAALSPAVVAEVQDAFGNRVNSTAAVTISSTPAGIGGTPTVSAVAGVATFSNLILPSAGRYRLTVNSAGLTGAISAGFPVSAASGKVLAITTQPVNQTGGVPLASVVVQVQGGGGALVTSSSDPVNLTSSSGGVSATVNAVGGVATFQRLIFETAGTFTLSASASGSAPATSVPFTIAPGAAAQLAFTVPPHGGVAGSPISPAVVVQVNDAFGNIVNSNTAIAISSTPAGVSGNLTTNAVAGVATFSNIVLPSAGNYMLTASAAGLVSAISMVGPAAAIQFIEFVQAMETASLQPVEALYLMWNQDLTGTSAPADSAVTTLARTLRADFAVVESQFTLTDDPSGAIAQGLMALVYGTQPTDFFFGLLNGTFSTVITPVAVLVSPLPPQVLTDSAGRLNYDPLRNQLQFTGYLDPSTAAALNASAGSAPLQAALNALATANQTAVDPFFGTYPELLPLYLTYVQSTGAVQAKRTALLGSFLPDLKTKRKQEQALAAITANAGVDPTFAPALLSDATCMLAAAGANLPSISDLTGVEAPGLCGWLLAAVGGTITTGDIITTTIAGVAVPYTVTAADVSLSVLAANLAAAISATPALSGLDSVSSVSSVGGAVILNLQAGASISMTSAISAGATETFGPVSGGFSGYLDVPQDGFFMFSVAADAGANITLQIDGSKVPLSLVSGAWQSAASVGLRAGELTGISLNATGIANTPVLSWQNPAGGLGWQPVPGPYLYSSVLVDRLRTTYLRFLKAASLASDLSLTADELAYLASNPDLQVNGQAWLNQLSVKGSPQAPESAALRDVLAAAMDFSRIKLALSPKDARLLQVLQNPAGSALLQLTRWSQDSLDALLQRFYSNTALDNLRHLEKFRQVYDAFAVVKRCGISAADLIEAATNDPSTATVAALQSALRALYAESDWLAVVRPINDNMRDQQRTALVASVLQQLGDQPATSYIDTADRLFEYFLMDVQMEPCMETSRLRNALSSVQLFIERCLRNLEPQVDPSAIPAAEWGWRKRYRVWQANREVFLWPENWLYPELRDDKSQFFQDAMSALLQGDITDDAAAIAYLNYLTSLESVAKLEPVGLYYTPAQPDLSANQIVHAVARTAGAHCKYYYRRLEDGSWTPWEEIKLEIEDTPVTPYVWSGRVMLFWLKVIKQMPVDPTGLPDLPSDSFQPLASVGASDVQNSIRKNSKNQSSAQMTVQAMLCWSEYYNGKWQPAKTSDHNRPIAIGSFPVAGDPTANGAFDRTQLRLRAGTLSGLPEDALFVGVEPSASSVFGAERQVVLISPGRGGAPPRKIQFSSPIGFVLYNTHSLPLRSSDVSLPSQPARPRRTMGATYPSATQTTFSIDYSQGDGSSDTVANILTSPMGERAVDCQPIVDNLWDAPFFFEDSRNAFYVTTIEEMVTIPEWGGYGILQPGIRNTLAVSIPNLVQVRPTLPPTRISPVSAAVNPGAPDTGQIQQFVSSDPYVKTAIGTVATVTYGGVQIGPAGSISDSKAES